MRQCDLEFRLLSDLRECCWRDANNGENTGYFVYWRYHKFTIMSGRKYLQWPETRGGLILSFVSGTALIGIFIFVLIRNIELKHTLFIWLSIFYLALGLFSIVQGIIRMKKRKEKIELRNKMIGELDSY